MKISYSKRLLHLWIKITVLVIISHSAISQSGENNPTELKVSRRPTKMQFVEVENGLRARAMLIELRTHPRIVLDDDQYHAYSSVHDSLILARNVTIIDSISITLSSGVSWNPKGEPPTLPKKFLLKVFTKKDRANKAMSNYLKYQDFCNAWIERNEIPYEMVEKFDRYYALKDGDDTLLKIAFELKFDEENRTRITQKEIQY